MRMIFDASTEIPRNRIEEGEEYGSKEEGIREVDGLSWYGGFGMGRHGRFDEIKRGGIGK